MKDNGAQRSGPIGVATPKEIEGNHEVKHTHKR